MTFVPSIAALAACACALALALPARAEEETPSLVRKNDCLKCHDIDQDKDAPSFRTIAARYKGHPDAEKRLVNHMAHGEKARFPDGHEETHKPVNTSPPRDMAQIKSLVQWILAQ